MATYSDDELIGAVSDLMRRDDGFRRQIKNAVDAKNEHWLIRLIKEAVRIIFGDIIMNIARKVLNFFLGI